MKKLPQGDPLLCEQPEHKLVEASDSDSAQR